MLPRDALAKYAGRQTAIANAFSDKAKAYIESLPFDTPEQAAESMKKLRAVLPGLTNVYANAAAVASADWFRERALAADNTSAASDEWLPTEGVGDLTGAIGANYKAKMDVSSPSQAQFAEALTNDLARRVKRQQARTTVGLANRNGLEWAWVPHGDTCVFCLVLASNGWQRTTWERAQKYTNHVHTNCDCTIQTRFTGDDSIEGYDPDELYEEYKDAWRRNVDSGNLPTSQGAINQLRRDEYAKDKDQINAQHREAYAKRKALGE